jgi:hypothetical protein
MFFKCQTFLVFQVLKILLIFSKPNARCDDALSGIFVYLWHHDIQQDDIQHNETCDCADRHY